MRLRYINKKSDVGWGCCYGSSTAQHPCCLKRIPLHEADAHCSNLRASSIAVIRHKKVHICSCRTSAASSSATVKYVFHGHSHQCRDHCNEAVGNGLYFVCCRFADIKPSLGLARPTVNSGTHPKSSVRLREMKSMTGLHRIVMAVAAVALAEAVDRVVVLAALLCWLSTSLFRGWPTEVFRRLQSASM